MTEKEKGRKGDCAILALALVLRSKSRSRSRAFYQDRQ